MVNANMFSNLWATGQIPRGFLRRNLLPPAVSAIFGTVLIGLLANLPLAQASGMGLNAFFVYTVCLGFGFTYANAPCACACRRSCLYSADRHGTEKEDFSLPFPIGQNRHFGGHRAFIAFLGLPEFGYNRAQHLNQVTLLPLIFCLAAGET